MPHNSATNPLPVGGRQSWHAFVLLPGRTGMASRPRLDAAQEAGELECVHGLLQGLIGHLGTVDMWLVVGARTELQQYALELRVLAAFCAAARDAPGRQPLPATRAGCGRGVAHTVCAAYPLRRRCAAMSALQGCHGAAWRHVALLCSDPAWRNECQHAQHAASEVSCSRMACALPTRDVVLTLSRFHAGLVGLDGAEDWAEAAEALKLARTTLKRMQARLRRELEPAAAPGPASQVHLRCLAPCSAAS